MGGWGSDRPCTLRILTALGIDRSRFIAQGLIQLPHSSRHTLDDGLADFEHPLGAMEHLFLDIVFPFLGAPRSKC
jgi:hypothetical protein